MRGEEAGEVKKGEFGVVRKVRRGISRESE